MKKGNRGAAQDAKKKDRQVKQQLRRARNVRKYGDDEWKSDWTKFITQLAGIGLTIKDVAGDGNCMFRSIADQMDGDPNRHDHYRQRICDYLENNEDDFAPFVEDDRTLAAHVSEMRRNATWGGHMELQAASMLLGINFTVHQLEQPRWEIVNHFGSSRPVRVLHLSYHDGQHYASVRTAGEDIHRIGTPAPIVIRSTAVPSSSTPKAPVDLDSVETTWQEDMVLRSTTASNAYFVRAVLIETDGDTDAAIEYIIALCEGGDLEESIQREFAYEHGIFPEGGFPEDDVPSTPQPTPTTASTSTPKSTTPPPAKPSSEPAKAEEAKSTAAPSAAADSPSAFELDAQLMEHMTDEEMAMYLQQEESRLWSEGHDAVAAFLRAASPVEAAPSAPSTSSTRAGSAQAAKRTESASPNRRDAEEGRSKPYKGKAKASAAESTSAPSTSGKPVHPKLERFQNQHVSNKQRNAMKRMEKEKPPAPQPTPPTSSAPSASEAATTDPEAPADLGSLQI